MPINNIKEASWMVHRKRSVLNRGGQGLLTSSKSSFDNISEIVSQIKKNNNNFNCMFLQFPLSFFTNICLKCYVDSNLQKIHKTIFKYNSFYTNKLKLQQVLPNISWHAN